MDNQLRYGVNLFLPLYVPSKCIISFVDLMHFIKSDCHLKIAYIIFNLNCSMLVITEQRGLDLTKASMSSYSLLNATQINQIYI